LGIAVPKEAKQVADIVRWATATGIPFAVRSGGNDFYGRNIVQGGLIVDMRDIAGVSVSEDRKTATIGGGTIAQEVVTRLEEKGLVAPFGNTWVVGYIGWATLGGYGPLTESLGMGFEGIVGAQVVNAKGDVVEATGEMLEGIRGMGGNLGIITSLTIKVYPARQLLTGFLVLDATPENIKAVDAVEAKFDMPRGLTLHNFFMSMPAPSLVVIFTWSDPNLERGQQVLDSLVTALPPIKMNTVKAQMPTEYQKGLPAFCYPWGGQRSIYIRKMTPKILEILTEALKTMPGECNMGWSCKISLDSPSIPKNCFGTESHVFLSFSYLVMEEKNLAAANAWNKSLYEELRSCGDDAILEGSYPPLTPPEDRTAAQLFGEKWERAKELKAIFDPQNVFKFAVPQM
ncbi:FAD-binding domain-containing protein, partial [Thozetella sp. PMI_491]